MSGRVTAEQTPDIEAVLADVKRGRCLNCLRMLATDEDWENTEEGERRDLCWEPNVYSCGWVAETTLEALQAAALASVLAAAVREARAAELREAADDYEAEVCLKHSGTGSWLRDRADRIAVDVPEGGEGR